MKFEFEINEEDILKIAKKEIEKLAHGSIRDSRTNNLAEKIKSIAYGVIEQRTNELLKSSEFKGRVDDAIRERGDEEIKKLVNQKVSGWVAHNVKEMLKYASFRYLDEKNKG